jgi:hypothetical protein
LESVVTSISSLRNDLRDFVGGFEPSAYTGGDAARLVGIFSEIERMANAGKLLAARRVEETRAHEREGHRRAGTWLASVTGEPVGQAVAELEAARAIESNRDIKEAVTEGRLSGAQVMQIASVIEQAPDEAESLVREAGRIEFSDLKKRCREARLGASSAEEEMGRHEKIRRSRYLRMWTDQQGAGHLEAKMTPEALGIVKAGIERAAREVFEEARKDGRRESRSAYMADALVRLVTGTGPGRNAGKSSTGKPLMRIRVDLGALYRGHAVPGEVCEIPGVESPIPVRLARELIGESVLELIVSEGRDVKTVVTDTRHVSRALRIALEERDQVCAVPGCTASDPLEIDHWRTEFAKGGETKLENLVRLCRYHHYLKTNQGWRLEGPPGEWRFKGPGGEEARAGPFSAVEYPEVS